MSNRYRTRIQSRGLGGGYCTGIWDTEVTPGGAWHRDPRTPPLRCRRRRGELSNAVGQASGQAVGSTMSQVEGIGATERREQ